MPLLCLVALLWAIAGGTASAGLIGLSTRTDSLYSIDPDIGAATLIGPAGGNYAGVGLSFLGGELFASDLLLQLPSPDFDVQTARISLVLGTSTPIGVQDGSLNWHGLASDETLGLLYSIALDQANQPLKAMAPSGVVTTIGAGTGIDGRGMAFDDVNRILYATSSSDESLYTVDVSTGAAQRIGAFGLGIDTSFSGLAYDEVNRILYLNGGVDDVSPLIGNLYSVDVGTGQASLLGSNGVEFVDGLAWIADDAAPVSEPAALALFSVGFVGLCFFRWARGRPLGHVLHLQRRLRPCPIQCDCAAVLALETRKVSNSGKQLRYRKARLLEHSRIARKVPRFKDHHLNRHPTA